MWNRILRKPLQSCRHKNTFYKVLIQTYDLQTCLLHCLYSQEFSEFITGNMFLIHRWMNYCFHWWKKRKEKKLSMTLKVKRERETDRERQTDTERERERQTDRERERETERLIPVTSRFNGKFQC